MKSISGSFRGSSGVPLRCGFGSEDPQRRPGDEMALKIEVVVHGRMDIEEALDGSSRFKALHLALSSSYHLVRVLGPIVLPEPLLMVARQPDVPDGSTVRAQLIGYHRLWREALFSQQLAYQLDGRTPVSLALNQYVEDFAFVIDGPPEIHPLTGDPNDHLVEMPAIARPRTASPEPSCDDRSEFYHPAANRLVSNVEPSLGKEFLDVAVA